MASLSLSQAQTGQERLCRGGHRKGSEVKIQQLCKRNSKITNIIFVGGHTHPPGSSPCCRALYTEAESSYLPQAPYRPHLKAGPWAKMAAGPGLKWRPALRLPWRQLRPGLLVAQGREPGRALWWAEQCCCGAGGKGGPSGVTPPAK